MQLSCDNRLHIMKTRRFTCIVLFLATSFFVSSCSSKRNEAAPKSAPATAPMVVDGVVMKPQVLDNIVRSSGTVLASESVDLVTEAAGRIEAILFTEGAHVRRNVLLLKINDDDVRAQLKKTELQIELANAQEARQKHLLEIEGVSKEQYDAALNQLNTLKADRENLIAAIRKREIRAPFDGVIGLRYVSAGGYVSQTTRIASIQKINPLKIDFAIPEKYANQVSAGDPVSFTNDETQQRFDGRVYAIEPTIDPATRTVQLRARCDNTSGRIFPGSYVQVELQLKRITNALLVPTQAIIPVLKGQTVLVAKNNVTRSVAVKTGIRDANLVQIVEGLSAGDTVITSGLMQLRTGMPVAVKITQTL